MAKNGGNKLGRWLSVVAFVLALSLTGLWILQPRQPTLEDKIGQMLMFGFLGSTPDNKWTQRLASQIAEGKVGGVVFLGHNFKTRLGVMGLTKLYHAANHEIPPFIALDMEGGFVQRLGSSLGYEKIPPAQTIAETMTLNEARKHFDKLAKMTAGAGFNVNLGPVVDLLVSSDNPVVAKWKRSYGANPETVVNFASQFIAAHRERGILTVLKHFPGHGSSLSDSHDGFVDISKTWSEKELVPFQTLIKSGEATAIMPGHLVLGSNGAVPVSLSKTDINGLLRTKLGFKGLVMSDDLQMSAIRKNYDYQTALVMAINAGVDVLMISNSAKPDIELPEKTVQLIRLAVKDKRISTAIIDSAYARIVSVKNKLNRKE